MTTLRLVVPKAPEGSSASLAAGTKVYLEGKYLNGVKDIKLNSCQGVWEATIILNVVIEGMDEEPAASIDDVMGELNKSQTKRQPVPMAGSAYDPWGQFIQKTDAVGRRL